MKCIFILLLFSLRASAQIEDLEKQMAENIRLGDSILKAAQADMRFALPPDEEEIASGFPVRNARLLLEIPPGTFSRSQYLSYIQDLEIWLMNKMSPSQKQALRSYTVSHSAEKLDQQAAAKWAQGDPFAALVLSVKAVKADPSDPLASSNLGALLTMSGAPHKAVPVLRTVLDYFPDHPYVLNNIGQAFASLGEKVIAMGYLGRCIAVAPYHPEACYTAGLIAAANGDMNAARGYLSSAMKAAHRAESMTELKKTGEVDMFKLIKRKVKMPDQFNPYKFKFPRQCENVKDEKQVEEEHRRFRDHLEELIDKYNAIVDGHVAESDRIAERMQAGAMNNPYAYAKNPYNFKRPFTKSAINILGQIGLELAERGPIMQRFLEEKERMIEVRYEQYKREVRNMEAFCADLEAAANRCMQDCAPIRREIQEKVYSMATEIYELMSYFGYLSGINEPSARVAYYGAVTAYLRTIQGAAISLTIDPTCSGSDQKEIIIEKHEVSKPDCPFDVEINILAADIKMDCDTFSISGGQGLKFKYERDFVKGQSTFSVAAGGGFSRDKDLFGVIHSNVGVSAEQSFYITFDKDNGIADVGIEFEASAGSGSSMSAGAGDVVKLDHELNGSGISAGYKIGINSGLSFSGILAE